MEWRVGGMDHRRNVDLAFKKSYLRTWIKPAIHAGKKMANKEESETGIVEQPRHKNCNSVRNKSYKTTNKISREVRRARETFSQTTTKSKNSIKERGGGEKGRHEKSLPSSLSTLKKKGRKKKKKGVCLRENKQNSFRSKLLNFSFFLRRLI
jgi:hypothetical protein